MSDSKPEPKPKPLFIYGTLCALPLLAWALTGEASNAPTISKLVKPGKVPGYARFALRGRDYPAVVRHEPQSWVDGYLLLLDTQVQRGKLDNFEGETYRVESVVVVVGSTEGREELVDADMYVWAGDGELVSDLPWDLDRFERERLEDWLDLFEGMELV